MILFVSATNGKLISSSGHYKTFAPFLLLFLLAYPWRGASQSIEFSAGANNYLPFDYHRDDGHFYSEYHGGFGYFGRLTTDEIKILKARFCFSFSFAHTQGYFYTMDGALGGSSQTKAHFYKEEIALSILPIHFEFLSRRIHLSMGADFCYLISGKAKGEYSSWQMWGKNEHFDLEDGTYNIFRRFSFGPVIKLAYDIKLDEKWYLVPHYQCYLSFIDEFIAQSYIYSFRQNLGIGIKRRFK